MPYTPNLDPNNTGRDLNPEGLQPSGNGSSQQEYRTFYDRPIPEMVDVLNRHREVAGLCTILKVMGASKGCSNPTTGHYERGWKKDLVQVGQVISGGAAPGEDMVIALDPESMYDTQMTANGAARQGSYPLEKEVLEFMNMTQARITRKNTSVNPHQLTLTPMRADLTLADVVEAGKSYMQAYNIHAEGSGLPKHRAPRIIKWSNTFGIVKAAFSTTGSEDTNTVRYHFEEVPGTNSINVIIEQEALEQFDRDRDGLFAHGQQSDNITEFSTSMGIDMTISGTQGFLDFARNEGHQDTYLAGAYTTDDLDRVAMIFQSERVPGEAEILCWDGPDIHIETENAFQQMLANNLDVAIRRMIPDMAPYASMNGGELGGNDMQMDLQYIFGMSGVRKAGFNFMWKLMPGFADPKGAGAEGYEYRRLRIMHPHTFIKDRKTGKKVCGVGYEYKELNGISREMVLGRVNGVGTNVVPWASNEFDVRQVGLVGEMGGHFALSNQIIWQSAN